MIGKEYPTCHVYVCAGMCVLSPILSYITSMASAGTIVPALERKKSKHREGNLPRLTQSVRVRAWIHIQFRLVPKQVDPKFYILKCQEMEMWKWLSEQ